MKTNRPLALLLFGIMSILVAKQVAAGNELTFRNTPLRDALKRISKRYDVRLLYDDNVVRNCTFTGSIDEPTVAQAMKVLLRDYAIDFEVMEDQIVVLYRKNYPRQVTGAVIDATSQSGLPDANIMIKNTGIGTTSERNGNFSLTDIPTGLCTLSVSYVGFKSIELPLAPNLPRDPIRIEMQPRAIETMAATVIADRPVNPILQTEPNSTTFSPAGIALLPAASNADISQAIHYLPGMQTIPEHLSGLAPNDGGTDYSLVLFDGIPLYHAEHMWGFIGAVSPDAVNDVRINSGVMPVSHGSSLSSVIELSSSMTPATGIKVGVRSDFMAIRGHLRIPLSGAADASISVRKSLNATQFHHTSNSLEDFFFLVKKGYTTPLFKRRIFSYGDVSGKIRFRLSPQTDAALTIYSGSDRVDLSGKFTETDERVGNRQETWRNYGLGLRVAHTWSGLKRSYITVSYSDYANQFDSDYEFLDGFFLPSNDFKGTIYTTPDHVYLSELRFKLDNSFGIQDQPKLLFGAEFSHKKLEQFDGGDNWLPYQGTFSRTRFTLGAGQASCLTFYFQQNVSLSKFAELSLGLRTNYHSPLNAIIAEPRLSFDFAPVRQLHLSLAWGHNRQFLHRVPGLLNDSAPSRTSYVWGLASDNLSPGLAIRYRAEMRWGSQDRGLKAAVYRTNYQDILYLLPIYFDKSFDVGSGVASGVELTLYKYRGWFNGWASYHFGNKQYRFPNLNHGKSFSAAYDRKHEFKVVGAVTWRNWRFSAAYIIAGSSQNTYQSPVIRLPLEDPNDPTIARGISFIELPQYQRLDISLSKKIEDILYMDWEFGLSFVNLLNHSNGLRSRSLISFENKLSFHYDFKENELEGLGRMVMFFAGVSL